MASHIRRQIREAVAAALMGRATAWDNVYQSRVQVLEDADLRVPYLSLPGTSGNYASTPDSAAVSITGDIDIRCKLALNDWTPGSVNTLVSKYNASGGGHSYVFQVAGSGSLRLAWSADGTNDILKDATALTGISDGSVKWARVTLDVDNGAGGNNVKFYTGDDGVAWTQIGSTITTAGITSIFDSVSLLNVGAANNAGNASLLAGKVQYAEIRNGIDGPVVAKFDARRAADGASSFTAETGEVWTINTSGSPAAVIASDSAALRVYTDDENVDIGSLGFSRLHERELSLVVECCSKKNVSLDDQLDAMIQEVETAIAANQGAGGAKWIQIKRIEIDMEGEAEKEVGVARMTFNARYMTALGAPDVAL